MRTLIAPTHLERNDISQESLVPEKGDVLCLTCQFSEFTDEQPLPWDLGFPVAQR